MNATGADKVHVNCLVIGILETLVATISTSANGLLLIVLYKNPFKSFRRPFSVLIIGLAATDFLKGILADSISTWIDYHCTFGIKTWLEDDWNFYTFLDYTLDNSATILVVFFAGDRLLAVAAPLFYRNRISPKKTGTIVVSVWLYAIFFSTLQFTGIPDETYDLVDSFLHIVVPMVLMISIHVAIFYSLKKRRKIETSQRLSEPKQETPAWIRKNQRLEKNFRYVAAVITIVLTVSQLPWLILVIIKMSCGESTTTTTWFINFELFAGFALSLTSAINPVLYCWRLKEYRRAVKALVTCRKITSSTTLDSAHNNVDDNFANSNLHSKDKNKGESKHTDLECRAK